MLALNSSLIGGNWLIYVSAIQAGHLFATSLGYYINPLANVLLGTALPGDAGFGQDATLGALIALSGLVTAVPLLLFAEAARRMDFSTLGFVQFISPTTVFLLGFFVFHEPLRPAQLASFVAIWCALAVFCWDLWAKRRQA